MKALNRESYISSLKGLSELSVHSFGRELDTELLKWRYVDNPCGDILAFIENRDEHIVANYSASPCVLVKGGVKLKTAMSMTTMTDPECAGQGLFTKLASRLYDYMKENNYKMIWGFPNSNSHYAFVKKLHWYDIYEIPSMRLDMNNARVVEASLARDDKFELDYSGAGIDDSFIHVEKSKKYLKWRYLSNPNNTYFNFVMSSDDVVSSFCIVKKYGQSLDIVDCQPRNNEEATLLLSQAIAFAKGEGLAFVNCWAPVHHFLHHICSRFGFVNDEPVTYFGGKVLGDDTALEEDVKQFKNWYVQMGDSDVF